MCEPLFTQFTRIQFQQSPSRFKSRPSSIILNDWTDNSRHSLSRRAPASAEKSKPPSSAHYRVCPFIRDEHVRRAAPSWPASLTSAAPSSPQACGAKSRKLNFRTSLSVVRGARKHRILHGAPNLLERRGVNDSSYLKSKASSQTLAALGGASITPSNSSCVF